MDASPTKVYGAGTPLRYRRYIAFALPFVVSTVTQPLLGAVDTAVLGRFDNSSALAGVAIGTVIFNTLYWLFGFFRVATTGNAAQSLGSGNERDRYHSYLLSAAVAACIGLAAVALQYPIKTAAMQIHRPEGEVLRHAVRYFDTVVWGAPFVLVGYVNLGWLMGRKHVAETMLLQISENALNVVLNLVLAVGLDMGVRGVAAATLIAQCYGFVLGTVLVARRIGVAKIKRYCSGLFERSAVWAMVTVNGDLFVRTVCLLVMTNLFVAKGGSFGADILAANAVLFQMQYLLGHVFDGLANASAVFAGRALGAGDVGEYARINRISTVCAAAVGVVLTVLLVLFFRQFVGLFTTIEAVIEPALRYGMWLAPYPLSVAFGLVYYGIFTGCSYTRPVRDSMVVALALFVVVYFLAIPRLGNHGLWLAFIVFTIARSATLTAWRAKMRRAVFPVAVLS